MAKIPTEGQINTWLDKRGTGGSVYYIVRDAVYWACGQVGDPCRVAFQREFDYDPKNDDLMWIGWVRCWNSKDV